MQCLDLATLVRKQATLRGLHASPFPMFVYELFYRQKKLRE
jgi:hypothetical protein